MYVDDIVLTGTGDRALVDDTVAGIAAAFAITDIGDVAWCLGISVARDTANGTVTISQRQYTLDLLQQHNMEGCKPSSDSVIYTLLVAACRVIALDDDAITAFQGLVGSLLWLSRCTRPDIAYAVACLSRRVRDPTTADLVAAKYVLRYLRGTLDNGITYTRSSSPH